jgi:hypothetical protein
MKELKQSSKVDLSNAWELLKVYTEIKTNLSNWELRDKSNNSFHKVATVAPFLKMAGMYIPRSREIVNGLNRAVWKMNHLLTTAEYFVDEVGFPYGTLPDYKEHCEYRGDLFPVFTDVFRSSEISLPSTMTSSTHGTRTSHHFRPSSTMR